MLNKFDVKSFEYINKNLKLFYTVKNLFYSIKINYYNC